MSTSVRATKLTARAVVAIRAAIREGEYADVLARRYRVSRSTISAAAIGKTWPHVPGAIRERFLGRLVRATMPDPRFTGVVYGKHGPTAYIERGPRRAKAAASTPAHPTTPEPTDA